MAGRDWRTFGKVHAKLFRLTGGFLFNYMGFGRKALLLTTTGRKSGLERTTPVVYMEHESRWIIYPSNGGKESPPAWWLNLQADERATIQVDRTKTAVTGRAASDDEHLALWPLARDYNSHWRGYEQSTKRFIPLVILERR